MLTKSEYIELQIASLTWLETIIYNRVFYRVFIYIMDIRYSRYAKYMEMKKETEEARKRVWNKIIGHNS